MSLTLQAGSHTDAGRRADNQDIVAVDRTLGLFVVADGTGGRAGGQEAARLASETLIAYLNEQRGRVTEALGSAPGTDPKGGSAISELIDEAIVAANKRVVAGQENPEHHGMATTLAVIWQLAGEIFIAHVGDSRIYLLRQGDLRQLTRDHSLANFLEDNPHLVPKAQYSPKTLVSAIGLKDEAPQADHQRLKLEDDDILIICSDGVSDPVPPWVLKEIAGGASTMAPDLVAQAMVRAAIAHGGLDNATAAVLRAREASQTRTVIFDETDDESTEHLGWLSFVEGPQQGTILQLGPLTTIGADAKCQLVIKDPAVSNRHAEVYATGRGFAVRDVGSTNGTFINKARVAQQCLVDGDVLRIGRTPVVFKSCRLSPRRRP